MKSEVSEQFGMLHKYELHTNNSYWSPLFVTTVSYRLRWTVHVAIVREIINVYNMLMGKPL
jgi:hypothetical protein